MSSRSFHQSAISQVICIRGNSATSEGADREASNELFSRDFSDEKEIHSTPTSSHEHANTVGDRFLQRVRSSWFGGFLRWRARTSCYTQSGCEHNACANSHPVCNFCAAQHSAPVERASLRSDFRSFRSPASRNCASRADDCRAAMIQPRSRQRLLHALRRTALCD